MKRKKERRKPIICPYCGHEMVCMNRFESIYGLIRGFYVWYVCPLRKGERGCGHPVLFKVLPKTKHLERIAVKSSLKRKSHKEKSKNSFC